MNTTSKCEMVMVMVTVKQQIKGTSIYYMLHLNGIKCSMHLKH